VLVPSLVYETFGYPTLEALAQGTPVIATTLGAVGELARASGGGLLYGSQQELLAAIGQLQGDPALRDELGRRGHDAFLEHWSARSHLERYLSLIEEARAGKSAGAPGTDPELVTV
jgi:glycosyltransferase involved in cell wall biosynthesis